MPVTLDAAGTAAGISDAAGAASPPADLAAAVTARFAADATLAALATGGVFDAQASDGAAMPYVVFRVSGGSPAFDSDTSRWVDQRVRFDCSASHASAANALARAVVAAFRGASLSHLRGVTTPLLLVGRSEAAEKARAPGNARSCRTTIDFSARSRLGRPS